MRLRPLARRRDNTARPLLVFMRERNPCVFERRRRLGWNVRFGIRKLRSLLRAKCLRKQTKSITGRLGEWQPGLTRWRGFPVDIQDEPRRLAADHPAHDVTAQPSGNATALTCTHVAAPRSRAKKNFCAVTFPKSIVLSRTAFPPVQTPIAHFFFRASIPCSHRQSTALNRVRAAYRAAFKGGSSFYFACMCDGLHAVASCVRPCSH